MRTVWNGGLALAGQMATKNAVPSTTEVNGTARKLCENILDGAAWAALLRGFETRQFGKIAKISGPRISTSEGRQDVEITGFEGDIVISLSIVGAVGGIRTLGRLLTVTRFPIVLVMTTSIPLHISTGSQRSILYPPSPPLSSQISQIPQSFFQRGDAFNSIPRFHHPPTAIPSPVV